MDKSYKKYIATISFQTKEMSSISDFLNKLDLYTGQICIQKQYKFTRNTNLGGEKSHEEIKENLKKAFEFSGCKVFRIKLSEIIEDL